MTRTSQIVVISYPSGGFGNFIYYALSECASNTFKVDNSNFAFSSNGDSHSVRKYMPVYFHDPSNYKIPDFDTDKILLVLCDNGALNDKYDRVNVVFPDSKIIRLYADEIARPVIYQTCAVKASNRSFIDSAKNHARRFWSDGYSDYAVRENFTLMYHQWPFSWKGPVEQANVINIPLSRLISCPQQVISELINGIGGSVIDSSALANICNSWLAANKKYFNIIDLAKSVIESIDSGQPMELGHITDLHDQGYINYCIEHRYNVTIPVYDYRNWFNDVAEIKQMISYVSNQNVNS